MKRLSAARLTTVLGILLGLAYLLVLSGRIANDETPSANNTSAGGLAAFSELLRASGYRVRVEDSLRARFRPDEFVIIPLERNNAFQRSAANSEEGSSLAKKLPLTPGGAMLLSWSDDVNDPTPHTYVNRVTREELDVQAGKGNATMIGVGSLDSPVLLYKEDGTAEGIGGATLKGHRIILVPRGEMASNRYLDGPGNAALLNGIVRAVAPGKEIVFYEGIAAEGGLLAALGDWAFAARNQLFLAVGLLVLSLGSRFGLAPKARRKESGQREQSDALGNLLRRWRGPRIGIDAAIEQSRRRLAAARRLPPSTPREQWVKYLSPSLVEAIEECEEWTRQNAREGEALRAITKLNAETDAEIMSPRTPGPTNAEVYRGR